MISVAAAALIAGTGFANAQGTGMSRETPSAGSSAQQSAPSSDRGSPSATPMNRDSASDSKGSDQGMKSSQSEEKMQPQGGKNQRAQEDMKGGQKGEKSAQDNNMKNEKSKSMSSETNEKGAAGKDMKAEGRQDRNGNMNAESKGADSKSQTTTGQAAAGAKLSGEQRTKITTVIRGEHVQPLTHANFSISVGTRVPRDVSLRPLPTEVVTIYPEWRGYEFVLVNEQIVVVDPRTLEIVAVIDA
jgi:hypothetical protein